MIDSAPTARAFQTGDGLAYMLRRVTAADAGLLAEFISQLSAQTRYLRFMTLRPCSPEFVQAQVARMIAGSAGTYVTLLALGSQAGRAALVAVAELACDHTSGIGEVAVVVRDDAQRKGIGGALLRQLAQIAHEHGLAHLHGDMLAGNFRMRRLICALGLPYTTTIQAGEMRVIAAVPPRVELLSQTRPATLGAAGGAAPTFALG